MSNKLSTIFPLLAVFTLAAQQPDPRTAYQQQQAIQEVQRLAQQFDQMEGNFEQLTTRMTRLESGNSAADLRAEISGIKAQIADLKREQENMRREIVAEISKKMAGLLAQRQPPPPAPTAVHAPHARPPAPKPPQRATPEGPYYEHIVEPGQTLSLIAKGYDTTMSKILAANPGLKPNLLRPGQKIIVPAEDKK